MNARIAPRLIFIGVLFAVSCSENSSKSQGLFDQLAARRDASGRGGALYNSPLGAMPQVRYSIDNGAPISVSDLYVVGTVERAEPGRSFRWTFAGDAESRHEVDFNAPEAEISTIHVTLRIERSIVDPNKAGAIRRFVTPGQTITFGLALSSPVDVEGVQAELLRHGTIALMLYRSSPVFDYASEVWAVLEDGALIGVVQAGKVTFRAVHSGDDPNNPITFSVEELESPATGAPKPVTFNVQTETYESTE